MMRSAASRTAPSNRPTDSIFVQRQTAVIAETLVQPAQGEGQQRQCIAGSGIANHGLDQPIPELQPGQARGALDDLGETAQRHGVDGHCPIAKMV